MHAIGPWSDASGADDQGPSLETVLGFSRQQQRVLWNDNGQAIDLTASLNNYRAETETIALVAADDYLFIGSDLPFNHKYIEVGTANDEASALSVAIWWANAWHDAVDLIDQTASAGVTLAQSGLVQWAPDEFKGWDPEQDSADVTGLETTKIYDMYWLRLAFSADLKATTALKYIGHKFCEDSDLEGLYPDLKASGLKTAWATGKLDWKNEIFAASEEIVRDLKRMGVIKSSSQLMDPEVFRAPCVHKAAEIIYRGLGGPRNIEMMREAHKAYKTALDMKMFVVDRSGDGRAQPQERLAGSGVLIRG